MRFAEFFHRSFGRTPYQYQERVASEVLAGKDAVLVAPTGAGKTLAALAPFFYAKHRGEPLADRVLYALPLRSLASALHRSISSLFPDEQAARITIQMGNQPDDPFFEGDVVFTTIDQLLSAYIGLPYGTSRASANIPPGALVGALVVIDEFHLLSYGEALPTFLDMMKRLHPYTQFLVMTATVPAHNVEEVTRLLQGVPLLLSDTERSELPEKTRVLHWQDEGLDAEWIVAHMGQKTLVVVNTVHRAQQLFLALQSLLQEQGNTTEIRCLHSQLFETGRRETESWVLHRFAKGADAPSLLITTQVVEAGLDISADVLLTELCPANALLQRIGRCARFPQESGRVHVCSVHGATRPYEPVLMEKTELFLKQQKVLELHTDWEDELIEFVHGEYDAEQMRLTLSHLPDRRVDINRAYVTGEANMSRLVRSVDSISVLIHPDPQTLRMELRPERVSVGYRKVQAFLKRQVIARDEGVPPIGWYPEFELDSWQREVIVWKEISSEKDLAGKRLICLAPCYVQYHADVGLLFTPPESGSGIFSKETLKTPERSGPRFDYVRETYLEHVAKVRDLYREEETLGVHQVAEARLAQALSLPPELTPAQLAELTGALHDIGKLTADFQRAVQAWQRDTRGVEESSWLAHTDFIGASAEDRESAKQAVYRRPPHAVEGSIMAFPLLAQTARLAETEERSRVVLGAMTLAIMRHHHAFSKESRPFAIAKGVIPDVEESLRGLFDGPVRLEEKSYYHELQFHEDLIQPDLLTLYWFLVRRLRLNDRRSQERLAEQRGKEGEASHVS